jgi:hypothetical protein
MTPGPGAVTAKAALQLLGVLGSRAVRLPYLAATPAEVARIADALSATGLDAAGPRPLSEKNVPAPSSAPLARSFP